MRLGHWLARSATLQQRDRLTISNTKPRTRPFQPRFERLEDRTTPAALSPFNFATLGTFNPAPLGTYTIDESGVNPVIRDTLNNVIFTGVFFNAGPNTDAVFDFDSFNLATGQTLTTFDHTPNVNPATPTDPFPVVILSRTTMTIAGTIDGSGGSTYDLRALSISNNNAGGQFNDVQPGGPGGGQGGFGNIQPFPDGFDTNFILGPGTDAGGPGGGPPPTLAPAGGASSTGGDTDFTTGNRTVPGGGAGGGGFGGAGAAGTSQTNLNTGEFDVGGAGGVAYGNIFNQLQGGSGGGGSNATGGGGGGGGIELGAVTNLTITATGVITVQGGDGAVGNTAASGGGGGGGLLMHAEFVVNNGTISAAGGAGGQGGLGIFADGGGGGGGRIGVIVAGNVGNFSQNGTLTVAGGQSGGADPGNPFGWQPIGIDNGSGPLPPGNFGPGTPDQVPFGNNGTLDIRTLPFPVTRIPNGAVKTFSPVRFTFNPKTALYGGFFTLLNVTGAPISSVSGLISIAFTSLPKGVTVLDSSGNPLAITVGSAGGNGIFGPFDPVAAGMPFEVLNLTLNPRSPFRLYFQFRDPLHVSLGTFFVPSFQFALFQNAIS